MSRMGHWVIVYSFTCFRLSSCWFSVFFNTVTVFPLPGEGRDFSTTVCFIGCRGWEQFAPISRGRTQGGGTRTPDICLGIGGRWSGSQNSAVETCMYHTKTSYVEYLFPKDAYNEVISPLSSYQLKCTFKQCPPQKKILLYFSNFGGMTIWGSTMSIAWLGNPKKLN